LSIAYIAPIQIGHHVEQSQQANCAKLHFISCRLWYARRGVSHRISSSFVLPWLDQYRFRLHLRLRRARRSEPCDSLSLILVPYSGYSVKVQWCRKQSMIMSGYQVHILRTARWKGD
jgi:hypothetical protein